MGTGAAQFLKNEYMNRIFFAVRKEKLLFIG
jgi:hypothetical protein